MSGRCLTKMFVLIDLSQYRDALPTVISRTAAQLFPRYDMKLEDDLSL
jgi:hypothetical protein